MTTFNYCKVIFESDSQVPVRMIVGEEAVWSMLHPIIEDIQHAITDFSEMVVAYQQRDSNKAADRIVKKIFSCMNNVLRLYSIVLSWLMSIVEVDKPL